MRDALVVALDLDGLIDSDGAVVTVQLRKLSLHGAAQPERAGARGQRHEDEYREADAQQAEDPAALPSQNGLSIRCIHGVVLMWSWAFSARDAVPAHRHHIVVAGSGREGGGLTARGDPAILIILSEAGFRVRRHPRLVTKELY